MRLLNRIAMLGALLCSTAMSASHASDLQVKQLIADIDSLRLQHEVPAVGLTLVDAQVILWSGAWGIADLKTRRPADADTLFRIGSITKSFTALSMLILQDQGRLRLSDELRPLAPDASFSNPWKQTHPVRISHLLEHTAGLLDLTKAEFDHNDPHLITLREGLSFGAQGRVTHWPPGMHSSYTNLGAGLAADVLERITGQSYEEFVEQQIFKPLGMSTAGLFLDSVTRQRLATGYDTDGRTQIPYWNMILRPFGGINATPRDMAPFLQLLINKGRYKGKHLLRAASIERMEVPETTLAARQGLDYGYGLGNYQTLRDGVLFHGHGGDGDGYLAHYAYNRDTGRGYFVVINAFKHDALRAIRTLIERQLIQGVKRPSAPSVALLKQSLLSYTGSYNPVTWRFPWRVEKERIHITLEEGTLYLHKHTGGRKELIPVNRHHFRYTDETVATMAFIEQENGELYLQGDVGNFIKDSN